MSLRVASRAIHRIKRPKRTRQSGDESNEWNTGLLLFFFPFPLFLSLFCALRTRCNGSIRRHTLTNNRIRTAERPWLRIWRLPPLYIQYNQVSPLLRASERSTGSSTLPRLACPTLSCPAHGPSIHPSYQLAASKMEIFFSTSLM